MTLKCETWLYYFLSVLHLCCLQFLFCSRAFSLPEQPSVTELTLALGSTDSRAKKQAALGLGDMGPDAENAIPELIETLKDPDLTVSFAAAQALGNIGEKALPALKRSLLNPEGKHPENALVALRLIGASAVPELTEVLSQPNSKFKVGAAEVLGKIGPNARSAVPELIKALKSPNNYLRTIAAEALGKIGADSKTAIPVLAEMLKDPNEFIRQRAAETISVLAGPDSAELTPDLIKALSDSNSWVRRYSAHTLGKIGAGAKTAVPALVKATNDSDSRVSAIEALGQIGPDANSALPAIEAALRDSDERIKKYAAIALGGIGTASPDSVAELLKLLSAVNLDLRAAVESSLQKIGPNVAPILIGDLTHSDAGVRVAAAETLRRLGHTVTRDLSRALRDSPLEIRLAVADVLNDIGPEAKDATPALILALKDSNAKVREKSAEALGSIGKEAQAAIPEVKKLLRDPVAATRERAQEALAELMQSSSQAHEPTSDTGLNQKLAKEFYEKAERMLSEGRPFKDVASEYRKAADLSTPQSENDSCEEFCEEDFVLLAREKYNNIRKFMSWTGSSSGEPASTLAVKYLNREYMGSEEFLRLLALRPEWAFANKAWLASTGNLSWRRLQDIMAEQWRYAYPAPPACQDRELPGAPIVRSYLNLPDSAVRNYIDCYLREAPKAGQTTFELKRTKKQETAQSCLSALARAEPRKDVLELFISAREHQSSRVRDSAYLGIANYNPDNALELLRPGLEDSSTDIVGRVITYLSQLNDIRSVELLTKLTNDPRHANAASCAIAAFGDSAIPYLDKSYANYEGRSDPDSISHRASMLSLAAEIKTPNSFEFIQKHVKDKEIQLRSCAAVSLYILDPQKAAPILTEILQSDNSMDSIAQINIRKLFDQAETAE